MIIYFNLRFLFLFTYDIMPNSESAYGFMQIIDIN